MLLWLSDEVVAFGWPEAVGFQRRQDGSIRSLRRIVPNPIRPLSGKVNTEASGLGTQAEHTRVGDRDLLDFRKGAID